MVEVRKKIAVIDILEGKNGVRNYIYLGRDKIAKINDLIKHHPKKINDPCSQ